VAFAGTGGGVCAAAPPAANAKAETAARRMSARADGRRGAIIGRKWKWVLARQFRPAS
jgi:hypothetical protein